jgi:hypothetical protein
MAIERDFDRCSHLAEYGARIEGNRDEARRAIPVERDFEGSCRHERLPLRGTSSASSGQGMKQQQKNAMKIGAHL